MLVQGKKDIKKLFADVKSFQIQNNSFDITSLQEAIDARFSDAQELFCQVDIKYKRNFSAKIIELKLINTYVEDLKHTLGISIGQDVSGKKKSQLLKEGNKEKMKTLQKKIIAKVEGLSELEEVQDVENYIENEFEELNILRLYQIYCSEVENTTTFFFFKQVIQAKNERFDTLFQSFTDLINDQQFVKIKNSIQERCEIVKLLEEYKDCLKTYVNSEGDRFINQQTQSIEKTSSFLEDEFSEIPKGRYGGDKQQQIEIKNRRKESSSETCISCKIF